MKHMLIFAGGLAATLGFGALWHGPLGAGERFTNRPEALARATLDRFERPMNSATLERGPLTRTMVLSGPADDFQRAELVRIMREIPGVSAVRWDASSLPQEGSGQ